MSNQIHLLQHTSLRNKSTKIRLLIYNHSRLSFTDAIQGEERDILFAVFLNKDIIVTRAKKRTSSLDKTKKENGRSPIE